MKSSITQKLKILSALLAVVLAFGVMSTSQTNAEELLPIFEPKEQIVQEIKVQVNDGTGFLLTQEINDLAKGEILNYLKINLGSRNPYIEIAATNPSDSCLKTDQENGYSQRPAGVMFIIIHAFEATWMASRYGVEIEVCHSHSGKVRLKFPGNWLEKNPQSPIKVGDCIPRTPEGGFDYRKLNDWGGHPESLAEYILCRVRPDLDLIIISLGRKGVK